MGSAAGFDVDDPESRDSCDLSPRLDADDIAPRRRSRLRRWVPVAVGIVIVAAIAVVASSLADATTYFYNVDKAVAQRAEIGDRRVRLQGNVIKGSVRHTATGLNFTIAYNGVHLPVRHTGDVPDLFGPAIPIVIEGRFRGREFASDRVLVKHDATYDEDNGGRIRDARRDADRNATRDAGAPAGANTGG
ncbi:MAG: cytochrome c maturation protein CcmE [Microthrixaceae bacterium]